MRAYEIVDVKIDDQELYSEYEKLTPASLASYGGKFIVRGPETEILEGEWQPGRLVILEFPTVTKAKAWWNSPEYEKAKSIRQKASRTNMIIADGYTALLT